MTTQPVSDPNTPIGEILKAAGSEGIVLESEGQGRYALLPLDDDVIDLLIERSPWFRADCHEIRERMGSGKFQTHEDIKRQLARRVISEEPPHHARGPDQDARPLGPGTR